MTRRDYFRPIINNIISAHKDKDIKTLRVMLQGAWTEFGFGPRKYWPYKVWCSEIRVQLGLVKSRTKPDTKTIPMFPDDK